MQCNLHIPNYWSPTQHKRAIADVGLGGVEPLLLLLSAFRKKNWFIPGHGRSSCRFPCPRHCSSSGLLPTKLSAGNLRNQDSLELKYCPLVCTVSSPLKLDNPY